MPAVQIGEQRFDKQSAEYQSALAAAHQDSVRPRCLCSPAQPELVVAQIGKTLYVKRMPGTGEEHDPECEHYELSGMLSGRGAYDSQAIIDDPVSHTLTLKLGFTLSQKLNAGNPLVEEPDEQAPRTSGNDLVAKSSMKRLNLRGFLDLIYDEAQLNRWWPRMEGKRFYGVVSTRILDAIQSMRTVKQSLANLIYMPKAAKVGEYSGNNLAFGAFMDKLKVQRGVIPNGFVIGELHQVATSYSNPRLKLKYCDEMLTVPEKTFEKFSLNFPEALAAASTQQEHFLIIARVHREHNQVIVNQITGMLCDQHWVPMPPTFTEYKLIDELNKQGRGYQVVLRYSAPAEQVMASVILLDTETPTPVFVAPTDDQEDDEDTSITEIQVEGQTLMARRRLSRFVEIAKTEQPDGVIVFPGFPIRLPPKRADQVQHPHPQQAAEVSHDSATSL